MSELFLELPSANDYPDYYDVIKDPISLNNIQDKIHTMHYTTPEDFDADMIKVFKNALMYNQRGTWVYEDAMKLRRVYKKKMLDLFGLNFYTLLNSDPHYHSMKDAEPPTSPKRKRRKKKKRKRRTEENHVEDGVEINENENKNKNKLDREARMKARSEKRHKI